MADFKIVEYDESLAPALADMWTRSGDGWGGWSTQFTADQVRQEEATSDHVNLYLAQMGDEVVGYCKIGKWLEEEGCLYVAMLNVRPDLHGRKIGKALMLRSVERTRELGWPRLDLHTWPGNTKAVPLYKKTGFFWEERDSEVYLVNFIPSVLSFSMTKAFFENVDWYDDATRKIEVQPDGEERDGFTYFTYSWEKDGRTLLVEYERKGRGLRKVARDDYTVTAGLAEQRLIHDRTYEVSYTFVNHSGQPLSISIEGRNDKNITFDYSHNGTVEAELMITAEFTAGPIAEEQHEWKTHPTVSAEITVNGESALFQVGILPLFPAEIRLKPLSRYLVPGARGKAALEVKSNLKEPAVLTLSVSGDSGVEFLDQPVELHLDAEGRASADLSFSQSSACAFAGRVTGTARTFSGEELEIDREVGSVFPTITGTYTGEIALPDAERAYIAGAGVYQLMQVHQRNEFRNTVQFRNAMRNAGFLTLSEPKLGKPYVDEFMKRSPESVEYPTSGSEVAIVSGFHSREKEGIEVTMRVRLHPGGMAARSFQLKNSGDERVKDLYALDSLFMRFAEVVVPYDGTIIEVRDETRISFEQLDMDKLTGNWLFAKNPKNTVALVWDRSVSLRVAEWLAFFEHGPFDLDPGETVSTPELVVYGDVFRTWQECREAAERGGNEDPDEISASRESLEYVVNNGNPFLGESCEIKVIEHKKSSFTGAVGVSSKNGSFPPIDRRLTDGGDEKEISFTVAADRIGSPEIIALTRISPVNEYERTRVIFPTHGEVVCSHDDNGTAYSADNGVLRIAADTSFSPGLHSCRFNGSEWLHTSYPTPGPMDWWNPWVGGICVYPGGMEALPLLKEVSTARFDSFADSLGNLWKGIAVRTTFEINEGCKGLSYEQRYLLLPGVPVLLIHALVLDAGGRRLTHREFSAQLFTRPAESIGDCRYRFRNRRGQKASLIPGSEECWLSPSSDVSLGARGLVENAHVVVDREKTGITMETNKGTMLTVLHNDVSSGPGETAVLPPAFLVFSSHELEDEWLVDMQRIRL